MSAEAQAGGYLAAGEKRFYSTLESSKSLDWKGAERLSCSSPLPLEGTPSTSPGYSKLCLLDTSRHGAVMAPLVQH